MSCHAAELSVSTRGRGFHDLTQEVHAAVRASGVHTGLCTVFLHHTSASLLISENAAPTCSQACWQWSQRQCSRSRASAISVIVATTVSPPLMGGNVMRNRSSPR